MYCTVRLPLLCHAFVASVYFPSKIFSAENDRTAFSSKFYLFCKNKKRGISFLRVFKTKETVDFHFGKLNKDNLCRERAWRRGGGLTGRDGGYK
jgi:hypothetical protein